MSGMHLNHLNWVPKAIHRASSEREYLKVLMGVLRNVNGSVTSAVKVRVRRCSPPLRTQRRRGWNQFEAKSSVSTTWPREWTVTVKWYMSIEVKQNNEAWSCVQFTLCLFYFGTQWTMILSVICTLWANPMFFTFVLQAFNDNTVFMWASQDTCRVEKFMVTPPFPLCLSKWVRGLNHLSLMSCNLSRKIMLKD